MPGGGWGRLTPGGEGGVEVPFDEPQIAVTPGQLAGFYMGDRCLGGAEIRQGVRGGDGAFEARSAAGTEAVAARLGRPGWDSQTVRDRPPPDGKPLDQPRPGPVPTRGKQQD